MIHDAPAEVQYTSNFGLRELEIKDRSLYDLKLFLVVCCEIESVFFVNTNINSLTHPSSL